MSPDCEPNNADDPLAAGLATALAGETGPVRIEGLKRLTGGASHETWAFDAIASDGSRHQLILRRDVEHGLINGALQAEYALLERLHAAGLPVARPWKCAAGRGELGAPYMVTSRMGARDLRKQLARDGNTIDRRALGRELVAVQAAIHAAGAGDGPDEDPLARWTPLVETCEPVRPLLAIALDWLHRNRLPPSKTVLVHGDFKANNLVFGDAGAITVIDWELAHRGDALEDLAWTLQWTTNDDIVGGLLSREEYLDAYARLAGEPIDARRLHFWEIFAQLKLAAMFLAGVVPRAQGRPVRPVYAQLHRALPVLEGRLARLLRSAPVLVP